MSSKPSPNDSKERSQRAIPKSDPKNQRKIEEQLEDNGQMSVSSALDKLGQLFVKTAVCLVGTQCALELPLCSSKVCLTVWTFALSTQPVDISAESAGVFVSRQARRIPMTASNYPTPLIYSAIDILCHVQSDST